MKCRLLDEALTGAAEVSNAGRRALVSGSAANRLPYSRATDEENVSERLTGTSLPVGPEPQYDVAISFLSKDQLIASYLAGRLAESLKVFYSPRNREKLTGTDPLDTMRLPFVLGSRVIVLLYRAPWGDTEWTRLEQSAIKEGCLSRGWSTLVFVQLERGGKVPVWLPRTLIRFLLEDYDIDQLIGVIKARVQERGGTIEKPQITTQAQSIQSGADLLPDKQRLSQDSVLQPARPKHAKSLLRAGDVEVDLERRRIRQGQQYLHLGPKEFGLLEFLLKKPGRVFSRKQLINAVWGIGVCIDERTVDVHIRRLRRAFKARGGRDPIRTVRGSGYAFDEDEQD
jgi:DNA-binding response OmpR family regulator